MRRRDLLSSSAAAALSWPVQRTALFHARGGAAPATLDVSFLSGQLDSRVTFSRASAGTYFDSAGVLRTANVNLLFPSTPSTAWGAGSNVILTNNGGVAPDGTTTALLVQATTTNGQHTLPCNNSATIAAGATVTASCYFKAAGYPRVYFLCTNTGFTNGFAATFNLSTGVQAGAAVNVGAGVVSGSSMTAVGNGWYRCSVTGVLDGTSTTAKFAPYIDFGTGSVFPGDNVSGLLEWGGQIEVASAPSAYALTTSAASGAPRFDYDPATLQARGLLIEEARTNLFLQSGDLSQCSTNASPNDCARTANQAVSPDGTTTATLCVPSTANGAHIVYKTFTGAVSTTYVASFFLKPAGYTTVQAALSNSGFGANCNANFDIQNGVVLSTGVGATASGIINAGNGWWRCWIAAPSAASAGTYVASFTPYVGTLSFPGNGTSGVYAWGGVVEVGAFPTSYVATTAASVARAADAASIPGSYAQSGSLVSDFTLTNPAANTVVASMGKGASLNTDSLSLRSFTALPAAMQGISFASNVNSGSAQTSNTYAQATAGKVGLTYTSTAMTVCLNAGAVAPAVLTAIPAPLDTIALAYGRLAATGTGWTRRVRYWNRVLSNSELQQATT